MGDNKSQLAEEVTIEMSLEAQGDFRQAIQVLREVANVERK